jgi:hypothetical protein
MLNPRVDTTTGLESERLVLAYFDLSEEEIAASAYVVAAVSAERFRTASMTADDVLALRELTALTDELGALAARPGIQTVVLRPARLTTYRDAVAAFIDSRDEAEWMREADREPLARVRALLYGLEDLCADALHAALAPPPPDTPAAWSTRR